MAEKSAEELLVIHNAGNTDREQWRSMNRDAYRYTQPGRDVIDRPQTGNRRHDIIFDSTGSRSHSRLANRLQDLLFPSGKNFVELKPGPAFGELDETQEKQASEELQGINDKFHASIWGSNFEDSIGGYLRDMGISMGAMLFNEGPDHNPFHFHAVPQYMLNFQEGAWGTISVVSRQTSILPRVAKERWPDAEIPEDQLKALSPGDKKTYVEIVYPDEESGIAGGEVGFQPTKWFYAVIDLESKQQILKEQRSYDVASPWVISRWATSPGEIRGRGPVFEVMPDVKTANKVKELNLKNGSLAVSGLWTAVDDGVFNPNTSSFSGGSVIVVGSNGGAQGPTLSPLKFPGNFDVSQLLITDLQSSIKQGLFDDDLPPISGPVRSPTEFLERVRALNVDIGPTFGRINRELIQPLVLRGLHILRRKGIINIRDDLKLDGQLINIQPVSPLARRQNLDNLEKVVQAIEMSNALVGEEVTQLKIKVEDVPNYISNELGVDEGLIRTPEEVAEIQQNLANRLQQEQEGGENV